jgi:hypothetical protein
METTIRGSMPRSFIGYEYQSLHFGKIYEMKSISKPQLAIEIYTLLTGEAK